MNAAMKALEVHVENKEKNVKADKQFIKSKYGSSNFIWLYICLGLIIIGGGAAWYIIHHKKSNNVDSKVDPSSQPPTADDNYVRQQDV